MSFLGFAIYGYEPETQNPKSKTQNPRITTRITIVVIVTIILSYEPPRWDIFQNDLWKFTQKAHSYLTILSNHIIDLIQITAVVKLFKCLKMTWVSPSSVSCDSRWKTLAGSYWPNFRKSWTNLDQWEKIYVLSVYHQGPTFESFFKHSIPQSWRNLQKNKLFQHL